MLYQRGLKPSVLVHRGHSFNDRILTGEPIIEWKSFWRELEGGRRTGSRFQEYVAPHQDTSIVFLRAYYRYLDVARK